MYYNNSITVMKSVLLLSVIKHTNTLGHYLKINALYNNNNCCIVEMKVDLKGGRVGVGGRGGIDGVLTSNNYSPLDYIQRKSV